MGTSVSHASPKTLGWQNASLGYRDSRIPARRVIAEVWRACQSEEMPTSLLLESNALFRCQEIIRGARDSATASSSMEAELVHSKASSVVTEFARRAAFAAFNTQYSVLGWRAEFFADLTDYLVSRDASGYVGRDYRAKTVKQLMKFRAELKDSVRKIVGSNESDPRSESEWTKYVRETVKTLSSSE